MLRRLLPLMVLVPMAAAVAAWLAFGADVFDREALLRHRDDLKVAAAAAPVATFLVFVAVYFAIISSALPVGPPMSLIAGFLFGRWLGTAAILSGATAGALVVFSVARFAAGTTLGARLRRKAGSLYETAAADLRANAFGYLVVMRLVPFFPFFLVNVVAGLAGVSARAFALATLIGRVPAAFLYVSLGEELGHVSRLDELARPRVLAVLAGLALLALLPVLVRRHRPTGRRTDLVPSDGDCARAAPPPGSVQKRAAASERAARESAE